MSPPLFVAEVKTRLGVNFLEADTWCPLCDAVLDRKGLHSRTCCAGGEKVTCHNTVRNCVFRTAKTAALRPELERAGLLLPSRPDDSDNTLRRPADVYLPAWLNGSPAALDFAITAPQRQAIVEQAAQFALASAKDYAVTKRRHMDTERQCAENGVEFIPMVAESTGAWEPGALKVLRQLARASALHTGKDKGVVLAELLQRLSVTIRRAKARALLRRVGGA